MSRDIVSRREFVGIGAAVAGASLLGDPLLANVVTSPRAVTRGAASDRVRFGIIGIGMQGSGLLGTAIQLPDVECVAACDLYDGRHVLAREIGRASCRERV